MYGLRRYKMKRDKGIENVKREILEFKRRIEEDPRTLIEIWVKGEEYQEKYGTLTCDDLMIVVDGDGR